MFEKIRYTLDEEEQKFESSVKLKGYKYCAIQYYFLFLPFYLKCGRIQIYMEIPYINKIIEVK